MSASSPLQLWQRLPSSSVVGALKADEDIEDVVALSPDELPEWLRQLHIPENWRLIEPPDLMDHPIARLAVSGPLDSGQWEAADTISVFTYTGWLTFDDVFRNADRSLRGLNATGVAVKVMPVPPFQWTAAVRSSGIAVMGDRSVWVQQSNYVAGSDQPHAGRLIVHTISVDTASRDRLSENIVQLSNGVYEGFLEAIGTEHRSR